MVLNVYLIRHVETDFNKKNSGFLQSEEMEINSYGIKQLKSLSLRLKKIKFDKIYSSDLIRAKQTAERIFGKEDKIIFDKRLREYEHGAVMPGSERWMEKYNELLSQGYSREEIRPFGGENIWDLIKRVKSFLDDIEKLNGNIAMISHSGANETFINLCQKRKKENFLKIKQDNGCIDHLKYENNQWEILTINDTEHLENLKPDVEYYEDISEINKKLVKFLGSNPIFKSQNIFTFGDLAKNKIGKYKRVFRRYFGTPIKTIAALSKRDIKKDWRIVCICGDYIEYEIGKLFFRDIKHKINLIIPRDYNNFRSRIKKEDIHKISIV